MLFVFVRQVQEFIAERAMPPPTSYPPHFGTAVTHYLQLARVQLFYIYLPPPFLFVVACCRPAGGV